MISPNASGQLGKRSITSHEALRIAHLDAEVAYRDLSGYQISLTLQPDGWHVDYEISGALMAGGGPHYVIDAGTGAIVSKRYEQ
ncbi:MAG: hypothetical protein ACJ8FY_11020 [Gemmataceae bacterium]